MTSADLSPTAVLADARWLAHRYDAVADQIRFLHTDRIVRRDATFLTDDYLPAALDLVAVDRATAVSALAGQAPANFILHSAFCCSTMLANALDCEGFATSLKEPVLLNDIVGWTRRGADRTRVAMVLHQALAMLSRPFAAGEAVVIKPSNVVNCLSTAMLSMLPTSRALLLHAPLRTFLGSVAKKGMWGRLWVRELFIGFAKDGLLVFDFDQEQYLGQTDLQIAGICWLAQQALFARLTQQFGERIATLDSDRIMDRPHDVVAALAKHFALALDDAAIGAIVAGPAFTRHSKSGMSFDSFSRRAEIRDAAALHNDEIEKVATWAEAVASAAGVAITLPRPLL